MARKKIEELKKEAIDVEEVVEKWSVTKIVIGILMGLFLGYFVYIFVHDVANKIHQKAVQILDQTTQVSKRPIPQQVQLPSLNDASGILSDVQQTVSRFSAQNISSSQSAIEKVIVELQQLQSGQKNVSKVFCDLACK